jgi:hypothetical protein
MLYLVQAGVALVLLIGLPFVLESPATDERMAAASIGALVLAAVAIHGIMRFLRRRKPGLYHDSVMPPLEPPKR